SSERGGFEQMPPLLAVGGERELREDRGGLGRPGGRAGAPQAGQPVAQLAVAGLGVENSLDDELRRHRSVPAVLLEPERNVVRNLLPEPVELRAEPERDRAAGIATAVPDAEPQVLAVADRRQLRQLTPGDEQRHRGIRKAERREPRE